MRARLNEAIPFVSLICRMALIPREQSTSMFSILIPLTLHSCLILSLVIWAVYTKAHLLFCATKQTNEISLKTIDPTKTRWYNITAVMVMTTAYNNAPASVRYPFGVDEYSRIGNAKGNWELGNGRYNDLDTVIISAVFSEVNIKSYICEILNRGR